MSYNSSVTARVIWVFQKLKPSPNSILNPESLCMPVVTVKTISPNNALLLKALYLKMMKSPSVFRIDDTEQRSYFDC